MVEKQTQGAPDSVLQSLSDRARALVALIDGLSPPSNPLQPANPLLDPVHGALENVDWRRADTKKLKAALEHVADFAERGGAKRPAKTAPPQHEPLVTHVMTQRARDAMLEKLSEDTGIMARLVEGLMPTNNAAQITLLASGWSTEEMQNLKAGLDLLSEHAKKARSLGGVFRA